MVCLASDVSAVDCGISHTIQNASKLSMNKVLEQGKTEMKRNSMDLWKKKPNFLVRKFVIFLWKRQTSLRIPFFI